MVNKFSILREVIVKVTMTMFLPLNRDQYRRVNTVGSPY
jgi:hypothetical protein